MMPKLKNIIIFVGIAALLVLGYVFFLQGDPEEENLVSSDPNLGSVTGTPLANQAPQITQDFLATLLNIKNIRLDDSIFSDKAFLSLHDSSIILIPDQNTGRPNPFAPIGSDNIISSTPIPAAGGTPAAPTNTPAPFPASSPSSSTTTTTTNTSSTTIPPAPATGNSPRPGTTAN